MLFTEVVLSHLSLSLQMVFGGSSGLSPTRLRLQALESLDKVKEAVDFLTRGVKLLGSDVANSGRVFMRAALGEKIFHSKTGHFCMLHPHGETLARLVSLFHP